MDRKKRDFSTNMKWNSDFLFYFLLSDEFLWNIPVFFLLTYMTNIAQAKNMKNVIHNQKCCKIYLYICCCCWFCLTPFHVRGFLCIIISQWFLRQCSLYSSTHTTTFLFIMSYFLFVGFDSSIRMYESNRKGKIEKKIYIYFWNLSFGLLDKKKCHLKEKFLQQKNKSGIV